MDQLFFELIRVAIGNAVCLSHTPTAKEWQMLYEMAKKQSLVSICFAGVQRLQAQRQAPNSWGNEQGEMLYLQWMGMAAKIQQRNEVLNRQCAELAESLKVIDLLFSRAKVLLCYTPSTLIPHPSTFSAKAETSTSMWIADGRRR